MEIIIDGDPKAQKRHRYRRTSGRIISYDPSSRDKQALAKQMASSMNSKPIYNGPICVMITFNFKRPKSHFRQGKFSHLLKKNAPNEHLQKPDIDNLIKFIFDAGNKIIWRDDSIIIAVYARKLYNKKAFTEIEIWDPKKD